MNYSASDTLVTWNGDLQSRDVVEEITNVICALDGEVFIYMEYWNPWHF